MAVDIAQVTMINGARFILPVFSYLHKQLLLCNSKHWTQFCHKQLCIAFKKFITTVQKFGASSSVKIKYACVAMHYLVTSLC